ncbi:hypothetical protein GCM10027072_38430 [Streptomyces bullii]
MGEELGAGLPRRHLDEAQVAAKGATDRGDLPGVGDGLRPGEAVGGALVAVVVEGAFGDGSGVVLVDGRGQPVGEDAAHGVAGADLRGPLQGVGGERIGRSTPGRCRGPAAPRWRA